MGSIRFRRRIVKWGNGYGIPVTRAEVEQLGGPANDSVEVEIRTATSRLDVSALHMVDLGRDASERHTELAERSADAGL